MLAISVVLDTLFLSIVERKTVNKCKQLKTPIANRGYQISFLIFLHEPKKGIDTEKQFFTFISSINSYPTTNSRAPSYQTQPKGV
jgi:hypothetical protein